MGLAVVEIVMAADAVRVNVSGEANMRRSRRPTGENVKWGVSRGLAVAAIYTGWVLLVYALGGEQPFARLGVTVWEVIGTYIGVGVSSGAVIGLLRPLTYDTFGAYVVGLLAGVPIGVGLTVCVKGPPAAWDDSVWTGVPVFCILIGLVVGYELRRNATAGPPGTAE
jgi:hypothetical protein